MECGCQPAPNPRTASPASSASRSSSPVAHTPMRPTSRSRDHARAARRAPAPRARRRKGTHSKPPRTLRPAHAAVAAARATSDRPRQPVPSADVVAGRGAGRGRRGPLHAGVRPPRGPAMSGGRARRRRRSRTLARARIGRRSARGRAGRGGSRRTRSARGSRPRSRARRPRERAVDDAVGLRSPAPQSGVQLEGADPGLATGRGRQHVARVDGAEDAAGARVGSTRAARAPRPRNPERVPALRIECSRDLELVRDARHGHQDQQPGDGERAGWGQTVSTPWTARIASGSARPWNAW